MPPPSFRGTSIYKYLYIIICILLFVYYYLYIIICILLFVYYYLYIIICILLFVYYYLYIIICILLFVYYYLYIIICILLFVYYYLYIIICILFEKRRITNEVKDEVKRAFQRIPSKFSHGIGVCLGYKSMFARDVFKLIELWAFVCSLFVINTGRERVCPIADNPPA